MEKMTYVKAIDVVLNGGEVTSEVREKLEALKASIAKKNGADRKRGLQGGHSRQHGRW